MCVKREKCCPYVSSELIALLGRLIKDKYGTCGQDVVINFRDPKYSQENGGFHPVEIAITRKCQIRYITDFSYVGREPFVELVKNLDFDFQFGCFQHFGQVFDLSAGVDIYRIWQSNFLQYHEMGVFEITLERY